MLENLSRVLAEHPTCDTLAGLSATRLDIPLAPPMADGDLGIFAGYRVVRPIGSGGMGLVYEAIDPALERAVALKVLKPRYAANAQAVARFLAEGRAAAAIVHDHVVTIYQVSEFQGLPYLLMELLPGCSLHQHAQGKALPQETAARIAREIAMGLRAVHAAKLVHRDVKPENIWLDSRTGRIRLLDFGLAFRPANLEPADAPEGLLGTPSYMSPEQIANEPMDARSDLFSLGVVLYELLAGRRPFAGSSLREILLAIQTSHPDFLGGIRADVSERLAKLTDRLLEKDPADRPGDAAEVIAELIAIEAIFSPSLPPTKESPSLPLVAPTAPSKGYSLRTVIGICSVLALAMVVLLSLMDGTTAWVEDPPAMPPPQENKPVPSEWVSLFNGSNLTGWHPATGDDLGVWKFGNRILSGTPDGEDHHLLTDTEYANFELELDYRWPEKGGHTSVLFHAVDDGTTVDAFEVNIGDDENFAEVHGREIGQLYRTGSIHKLETTLYSYNKPIGEWNHLRVQSNPRKIQTEINGNRILNLNLDEHANKKAYVPALGRTKGRIGLKLHFGAIEFASVRIRLLGE